MLIIGFNYSLRRNLLKFKKEFVEEDELYKLCSRLHYQIASELFELIIYSLLCSEH